MDIFFDNDIGHSIRFTSAADGGATVASGVAQLDVVELNESFTSCDRRRQRTTHW
jgi:hypothetical protein